MFYQTVPGSLLVRLQWWYGADEDVAAAFREGRMFGE